MQKNFFNYCSYELEPCISNKRFLSILYDEVINRNSIKVLKAHPEFPTNLYNGLEENYKFRFLDTEKILSSSDETHKFLFQLQDHSFVETVAIPFHAKYTICLSSQVGCAMKCSFCFTGDHGFKRNLEPYEIVCQYLQAWNFLKKKYSHSKTPNIVFMGQGEPLNNVKAVRKAIDIFMDIPGVKLGPKQITLSTVGVLDELKAISSLPPVNLAISLHSARNELRDKLIPSNKKLGVDQLFDWVNSEVWSKRRKINFEYLLLKDVNTSNEDAFDLVNLLKGTTCIVNLIPFNPYPEARFERPSEQEVENFKRILVQNKIRVMVRKTKGDDILAACGQLANA